MTRKILIIGNSHSVDAFHHLCGAFKDQNPGMKVVTGVVYYSGCSITQHVEFHRTNQAVYDYYKNDDGDYSVTRGVTIRSILSDEAWDTVFLQAAKSDLDEDLNRAGRRALEAITRQFVPAPFRFMWHTSWPSPNDETFFSPDYVRKVPAGYKERLVALYGFNPRNQFTVLTDQAKKYILPDKTYCKAVCTGAAVMNAHFTQQVPQLEIWRDYTHLNDFGQLMVAYAMTAQLMEKPVEKVGIDLVPQDFRHKQYRHLGDMEVTPRMKEIIITAANEALKNPWLVP